VSVLNAALVLAEKKTPDEEGLDVILVMLAVGLIFLGTIVLGQLARYVSHKRAARREHQRAY
jgi:hypothetical protein